MTLGASKETIEFGEPGISSEKTAGQLQMEVMLKQRMKAQGKKPAVKAAQPPVVVGATVKADLPLKAATAEELLLVTHQLQEKIKAADLSGIKELAKLSPQDEELAEELEAAGGGYVDPNEVKRGEPFFLFVCKVSDEEHDKAVAEAFRKARLEASRLARAAGADLGALSQLSHQSQGTDFNDGSDAVRRYYAMQQQGRMAQLPTADENSGEAVGLQPGKVSLRIAVSAQFFLKPPTGK